MPVARSNGFSVGWGERLTGGVAVAADYVYAIADGDPVALSRMLLRAKGYAVLPLTALPGAGPDLVGIDLAGGRMLGVLAADGRAGLLPKLVATLGCRSLGRLLAAGRLRIELHLWERRDGQHVCRRSALTAAEWGEG
jgi:hypothetical protein